MLRNMETEDFPKTLAKKSQSGYNIGRYEQDGFITPAVKYCSILLAQTSICCVVINRCSPRYSSIFRLAYEDLFCVIYCDI